MKAMKIVQFFNRVREEFNAQKQSSEQPENERPAFDDIKALWSDAGVGKWTLVLSSNGVKSVELSNAWAQRAEKAFQNNWKYNKQPVLDYRNKAIIYAPHPLDPTTAANDSSLPLAFYHRAITLDASTQRNANFSNFTLADVNRVIDMGCPHDILWKMFEIRGRCEMEIGMPRRAYEESFQMALKLCDLYGEMRRLREVLKSIAKCGDTTAAADEKPKEINYHDRDPWEPLPTSVADGPNARLSPSVSSAVQLEYSDNMGRHLTAARDINVGEVLNFEMSYAYALASDKLLSHCTHCVKRCCVPVPCRSCAAIVFCSEACESQAWLQYHRLECGLIPDITRLVRCRAEDGETQRAESERFPTVAADPLSTDTLLVFRIITRVGARCFFEQFKQFVAGSAAIPVDTFSAHPPYNLRFNDMYRTTFLCRSILCLHMLKMTTFFDDVDALISREQLHCKTEVASQSPKNAYQEKCGESAKKTGRKSHRKLKKSENKSNTRPEVTPPIAYANDYIPERDFNNKVPNRTNSLADVPINRENFEIFIGHLFYVIHQACRVNAQSINEYRIIDPSSPSYDRPNTPNGQNSRSIGSALYKYTSFLNHSCFPNVVTTSHSSQVVVRALRPIKRGEQLLVSYCDIDFSRQCRDERQAVISRRYGFDCRCMPCYEHWSHHDNVRVFACPRGCDSGLRKARGTLYWCNTCAMDFTAEVRPEASASACYAWMRQLRRDEDLFQQTGKASADMLDRTVTLMNNVQRLLLPPSEYHPRVMKFLADIFHSKGNCYRH